MAAHLNRHGSPNTVILSEARAERRRGEGERRILVMPCEPMQLTGNSAVCRRNGNTKILRLRPRGPRRAENKEPRGRKLRMTTPVVNAGSRFAHFRKASQVK